MRSFKLAFGFVVIASVAVAQSYPSPIFTTFTVTSKTGLIVANAGSPVTAITPGTGVATALGNATNSSGGFLAYGTGGFFPVAYADIQSGADACAKIVNAITSLPATGGTVDARGLSGTQSCSGGLTVGTTSKPIALLLGNTTITSTGPWVNACHSQIIGLGKTPAGTQITFSGIGSTTDNYTQQFCSSANNEQGSLISGVLLNCNGTGQDCARVQGGRNWFFDAGINSAARDGLVIGGTTNGQWTELATVTATIYSAVRHGVRLDTTAATTDGSTFINHINFNNLHVQDAGGNLIRAETGSGGTSNNGLVSLNFINFLGLNPGTNMDGIYLNGNQSMFSLQFLGGEIETVSTNTGCQLNASQAQQPPWVQSIYYDTHFTGGQFCTNVLATSTTLPKIISTSTGVALQMLGGAAIRDVSTSPSNLYFDVGTGTGSSGGVFRFRGSQYFTPYVNIAAYGIQVSSVAIASLQTCNATSLGAMATVSNGTAYGTGTYGSAVSATGAVTRNVICTNTAGATTYAWAYN